MSVIWKRLVQASLSIGGSVVLVMTLAGTATAATPRNGVCEPGEFCLYFSSGLDDSVSDFNGSIPNYGTSQPTCYEFKGPGNGRYLCVWHNAGSVWNRTTANTVTIYSKIGYTGNSQVFRPGQWGNLNINLFNQNESHRFVHTG